MNYIKSFFIILIVIISSSVASHAQTAAENNTKEAPVTSIIKVKGVTCSADVKTLAKTVEALTGVVKCKPLKKGAVSTFEVTFHACDITKEEIHKAFEDTPGCKNPNDRPYKVKG